MGKRGEFVIMKIGKRWAAFKRPDVYYRSRTEGIERLREKRRAAVNPSLFELVDFGDNRYAIVHMRSLKRQTKEQARRQLAAMYSQKKKTSSESSSSRSSRSSGSSGSGRSSSSSGSSGSGRSSSSSSISSSSSSSSSRKKRSHHGKRCKRYTKRYCTQKRPSGRGCARYTRSRCREYG